jgi:hypothetical protein
MATNTETSQSKSQATPKAEPPFPSFDPMTFWSTSQQAFHKAMTDAYGRAQSWADQYAAMEQLFVSRAQGAVSNWAQLTQDAIAYSAQLSAEARKLGLDAIRKASAQ